MKHPLSLSKPILTASFDLFLVWVLVYYGMGGIENGIWLLTHFGWWPWLLFGLVIFLLLYRSDYRTDLPLFLAGWLLGYWGEWWGTTRGVWVYWNGAQPPDYLPPLWGLGLLTAYRLAGLIQPIFKRALPRWISGLLIGSFFALPLLGLAVSWQNLAGVNWQDRLDLHFFAGILAAALLILPGFDLHRDFPRYLCGMLLGGLYEYLGTLSGEWSYVTGEIPPIWIIPLWGLAVVAMVRLADWIRRIFERLGERISAVGFRFPG